MKQALHLLDTLQFGGGESVALNYARLTAKWGMASTLVGRPVSAEFIRHAKEECNVGYRLTRKLIREADMIFIHTNRQLLRLFLLRPWFRFSRKQVVYIQHLPYSERKFRWLARIINCVCTDFVRITPLTEQLVSRYIRIGTHFIPNFYVPVYAEADHDRIRQEVREQHSIVPDATVVLFSGVLRPGKGLPDFLSLAGRMADDSRFIFLVVGDGEESLLIRQYTGRNLHWVAWTADMERYLIAADSYCFLSRQEMMPMALIEALALGKPVFALDSPVNDWLLQGETYDDLEAVESALRNGSKGKTVAPPNPAPPVREMLRIDRLKKILHIQVLPKLTGVQRISLSIFQSLPRTEYEKSILFGMPVLGEDARECLDRFRDTGSRVWVSSHLKRGISLVNDFRAVSEIYRLCRRERFDIVHTHSTKPGIVGRFAAWLAGVPLVIHTVHGVAFHHYQAVLKRFAYYVFEWLACPFSHRITLVSPFYQPFYRHVRKRTTVVPNGMDFAQWEKQTAGMESLKGDGLFRILFVGRLELQKDPLTLLQAFSGIIHFHHRKEARLTLVGDGELMEECRIFIRDHRLEEYVELAGWQSNVAPYYMNHQLFCLSSIFESFGLCFLEAGFCGLPTVATRVEGIPEVIADGETGFLVPPRDPQAMSERILALMDDPALCKRMGDAARQRVTALFPLDRMTEAYQRIYRKER